MSKSPATTQELRVQLHWLVFKITALHLTKAGPAQPQLVCLNISYPVFFFFLYLVVWTFPLQLIFFRLKKRQKFKDSTVFRLSLSRLDSSKDINNFDKVNLQAGAELGRAFPEVDEKLWTSKADLLLSI